MTEEIIIAGFGGQGILSIGKILAYSGLMQGQEVSWFPSYGPEMRGGTANVSVIISDERISSPSIHECDTAIILNQQSLLKFEPLVRPGGVIIYDNYGIQIPPTRKDVSVFLIEAANLAHLLKNSKTFNMIVLGAYLKARPIITMEFITQGIEKSLPSRHKHLIPINMEAVKRGMEAVKAV